MLRRSTVALLGVFVAAIAFAQPPTISLGELGCLPVENNAALTAEVSPDVGAGSTVRMFFRRLNPVGAWYYHIMMAEGGGDYWTDFPRPEDREQPELTDEWWQVLKDRDWVAEQGWNRDQLADWLEDQENEAAEYYVAVVSADRQVVAKTPTQLVPVKLSDCPRVEDTPDPWERKKRIGLADSLTVGETTQIQAGRQVFHWLCDGIITRIGIACKDAGSADADWQMCDHASIEEILRPDEFCRACVVGLIPRVAPLAAVAAGIVTVDITEEPSEEQPPQ